MKNNTRFEKIKSKKVLLRICLLMLGALFVCPVFAQAAEGDLGEAQGGAPIRRTLPPRLPPKPIVITKMTETLEQRMDRMITLDVREMNVIDVLKFLALKGDFNMITSDQVQGRVTLFLRNVAIGDALDIVLISNKLAYYLEHSIVNIVSEAEYQATFGRKYNDKVEVAIIQLVYAKPSYVLSALDNVKSSLGRIIIDEDTGSVVMIDTPQSLEKMKDVLGKVEKPLESVVYTLQFAKADVVAEKLKARIDANAVGSVTIDERTNKIVVRAFPGRRKEVADIIRILDAPTKEVLVEARVLQVTFKPQFDFGIDWQLDFRDSPYQALRRTSLDNDFLDTSKFTSAFTKVAIGDFNVNKFQADIRALKQVSDTKVLSNPKILVTNNEEAKIHVGDTVPYIISTTSGTGENAITSEDVRFVDVGLQLNVTPTINDEGFVTMALRPEISAVTATVASQGGGIPLVTKTLVETTIMVKNGMTVVLGGLKSDSKVLSRRGIPFLMDVPLLKGFFSTTSETVTATEIVIFITPHIVTGDEGAFSYKGTIKPSGGYEEKKEKSPAGKLKLKG